jgi:hypothetical protein
MVAGERLVAADGKEVALFPCDAMYLTQGPHDVLALDFGPRNTAGQRISPMNCYAPFSGTNVYTGNDHNCILESDDVVHWPDGRLAKMRVLVAHSWNAPTLYQHFNQGDLWYTTGNYGFSSDEHLHMECALAAGSYWRSGGVGLNNGVNMWECLFVNDTVILNSGGYNWRTYDGPTPPPPTEEKKHKFPWFMYARRFRERANV